MPTARSSRRSATSIARSSRARPSRCCRPCRWSPAAPPTRLGLTDDELALACASHGGEAVHAETAAAHARQSRARRRTRSNAAPTGPTTKARRAPRSRRARTDRPEQQLLGQARRLPLPGLCAARQPARPAALRARLRAPRRIRSCARSPQRSQAVTGHDLAHTPRGTDGCSIPTFAVPLRQLALAFARVGTGIGLSPGTRAGGAGGCAPRSPPRLSWSPVPAASTPG